MSLPEGDIAWAVFCDCGTYFWKMFRQQNILLNCITITKNTDKDQSRDEDKDQDTVWDSDKTPRKYLIT